MEHASPTCLTVGFYDIGDLAGMIDHPRLLLILSTELHSDHRASVARSLLEAGGVEQPLPYEATCTCGQVLRLDDQAAAVS